MKHIIYKGIVCFLLLAMLLGMAPSSFAEESATAPVPNDDLNHAEEKILGYWINPSNFTISNTNIDNLVNLGVTDFYVLVKGEAGSINTTALKNVISYASSEVRVHAWLMCARDNTYLKNHPTHAVYHFRVGYKNNAHSSSSSYYDTRNGFVDLRNTSYQNYFNGIVDDLEAISGLDGIHLDTIRYGGDYYDWHTNLKNTLGKSNYNAVAKAMCEQHGYTYAADSNGYYAFSGTTDADDSALSTLVNANGAAAKAYREYRTATVTNFVKSVRNNLSDNMILTAACMPEPALSLYGKSTYGQDFASMAPYVDYVQIMSYFGDYYFVNNNTYDTSWPANICKSIAKEGCNVVAGIQGYAFVNEDTERNGQNPTGYESQKQAETINDARRAINGDPSYGGDILGSAVFRGGTSSQASVVYDPSAQTVTFRLVAGDTAIKSVRIRLYNGFFVDKSKCTVSGTSYTYNNVTYTVTGTATNEYYHTFDLSSTISAYGTKTLTIPVCNSDGTAVGVDYNYNHFAAVNIYSSTTKSNATYLPIYLDGYVNSAHKTCSFTKTTPQPATCLASGYHLYTCKTCGYDYSEYIPQLSHEYVATVTAPTCTEDGFTTYACKNGCNNSYTQDPVAALGHSYEMTVTEPTCTENGATIFTCSQCDDRYEDPIEALGHQYDAVVTTPDCESEGFTTYTCACGDSYVGDFVPALGHSYTEELISSPTCTTEGTLRFTCTQCDDCYEESVDALGHQYDAVVTAPDCESEGFTTYTCACGDSYVGDFVPALGHSYTYTELEEGHLVTCNNCDLQLTEQHNFDGNTCTHCGAVACMHEKERTVIKIDATCTEVGFKEIFCADCGEYLRTDEIPASGHSLTHFPYKLPTCTESGNREHWKCESCGSYFTDASCNYDLPPSYANKPALGHSYTYTALTDGTHKIACDRCDYHELAEHYFEAGSCICGAKEAPKFDKALTFSMNISAGAEMVVNYTIMAATINTYQDFYLEVTKSVAGGEPVTTVFGPGERESLLSTYHPVTGAPLMYAAAYRGINAKEMGDAFSATLYAVSQDGTVYHGETVVSSIRDYLIGKLNDPASIAEMKTMAVDMLKYGAAAQIRLSYDTAHLVTDALTNEQLSYATQSIPTATDHSSSTGDGAGITANITIGARVELSLSAICMNVSDPAAVRCLITDAEGKVLAEPSVVNVANIMFSAMYANVGAKQMRDIITVTFYDCETAISKTLSWSVESYVAQIRANENVSEDELNMVNALLTYGDSVAAYMTASGQ